MKKALIIGLVVVVVVVVGYFIYTKYVMPKPLPILNVQPSTTILSEASKIGQAITNILKPPAIPLTTNFINSNLGSGVLSPPAAVAPSLGPAISARSGRGAF